MENQCMLLTVRNVSFDIFTTALSPFTFDVLPTRRGVRNPYIETQCVCNLMFLIMNE